MNRLCRLAAPGRARWAFILAGAFVAAVHAAAPMAPSLCIDNPNGCATAPAAGSYPWYPSLNLNAIPWHTASGAWGPQVVIQAPAAPVTTRSVSVSNPADFATQAGIAGTRITIATGWAATEIASIRASDIDVIIPAGVSIGAVQLGSWPYTDAVRRVRIRGPVVGQHSGGRMGQFRDFELATDIIIDGIDVNGASSFSGGRGGEDNQAFRVSATRLAVLNTRVIAGGYAWLGDAKHVVIANSNFYHGAASRASVGYPEGWGIRNTAGPITIVDSRIQGTRYHNLRAQSTGGSGELLYVTRTTFVAQAEGRTASLWNNLGNGAWNGQGAIIEDSDIYTYATSACGLGAEINSLNVTYSRVRNNRFRGAGIAVINQAYLNERAAEAATGSHDWSVGNTFQTLQSFPAWTGPGDPTQVPLPTGLSLITGEGSCLTLN